MYTHPIGTVLVLMSDCDYFGDKLSGSPIFLVVKINKTEDAVGIYGKQKYKDATAYAEALWSVGADDVFTRIVLNEGNHYDETVSSNSWFVVGEKGAGYFRDLAHVAPVPPVSHKPLLKHINYCSVHCRHYYEECAYCKHFKDRTDMMTHVVNFRKALLDKLGFPGFDALSIISPEPPPSVRDKAWDALWKLIIKEQPELIEESKHQTPREAVTEWMRLRNL